MTKEDAIEHLEYQNLIHFGGQSEALKMAISALKPTCKIDESNFSMEQYRADLQSAYDCGKAEADEWIPVSKRLPEEGHVVYCQLTDGSHEILFLHDNVEQMNWVGRKMGRTYDVTAWRELPESYKGESEDKE